MASLVEGISFAIRCIKRDKGDGGVISARPVTKTFCSTKGTPYYRLHKSRLDFDEVVQMTVEGVGTKKKPVVLNPILWLQKTF